MPPGGRRGPHPAARQRPGFSPAGPNAPHLRVRVGGRRLPGLLTLPDDPAGFVILALGAGSSHLSPTNRNLQAALSERGFAVLLFDLLDEEEAEDIAPVFDIGKLAGRIVDAVAWSRASTDVKGLPVELLTARTGTAAGLLASALLPGVVKAHVAWRGRPDLAHAILPRVNTPTLFLSGCEDEGTKKRYAQSVSIMTCVNITHEIGCINSLFTGDQFIHPVIEFAEKWFSAHS